MTAKNKSNELRLIRIFDAPVAAVWDAWTDPEQVLQWWGPRGFSVTTHSRDFRAGGHWSYTMHGPDGVDWPNRTVYHEVEKHTRLVYDHGGAEDRPPLFRVTAEFRSLDGGERTELDMRMTLPTPEAAEETRKFIKKAGGDSTWDRLAEFLDERRLGKKCFVLNRSFDASLETMFEMWSNPEHLAQWVPPTGFTMEYQQADIRPGGSAFYVMKGHGLTMYGRAEYLEIRRPDRLVYTQQFCDERGRVSRHPLAPTWPETLLTIITLTSEGANRTRVRIQWEPYGKATAEEIATFVRGRSGMTQGWTGSLDKLEELIGKAG